MTVTDDIIMVVTHDRTEMPAHPKSASRYVHQKVKTQ